MYCLRCEKTVTREVCGACRDVNKLELVEAVLRMPRVYIGETNLSEGRPRKKLSDSRIVKYREQGLTLEKIAEKMQVSEGTIRNRLKAIGKNIGKG